MDFGRLDEPRDRALIVDSVHASFVGLVTLSLGFWVFGTAAALEDAAETEEGYQASSYQYVELVLSHKRVEKAPFSTWRGQLLRRAPGDAC